MKQDQKQTASQNPIISQLLRAILLAAIVFILAVVFLLIGFEVAYADRVYPGVYVQDIDLSGKTLDEASERLARALPYAYEGKITVTYEGQVWEANPIDLGYVVDPASSAQLAFDVGRQGWLPGNLLEKGQAWFKGVELSPLVLYDERAALVFLQSIAESVEQPVREASLSLKNAEVVVVNGQVGKEVDIPGMLSLFDTILKHMQDAEIPLIVKETPPEVLDVSVQAALARQILSEPLVLKVPDNEEGQGPWTISPEDLAPMLNIERGESGESVGLGYQIAPNEELFNVYLKGLAPGLSVKPVNARFIFNDDTGLLDLEKPAVIGRTLDVEASIGQIREVIQRGEHQVSLQFEVIEPAVTDETTGEELGITELVHQETTYFYGSDAARVQNITTASEQFHGLLLEPGETFSMGNALGNISLDNGYAEALIIYGDQTIQGVGGGVCQVSTTLFRAAFFAGFPIVERHAHAYRVSYYEQRANGSIDPNLAGLDATVYFPLVDLKFVNDTQHWLLMETYLENYSLTWKFYSTSDNRSVTWQTTGPTDVVPAPDPICRENADLAEGQVKKVDYAADGAKIYVNRTVYNGDQIRFSDSFFTQFQPWQEKWEYGPGTEELPSQCED